MINFVYNLYLRKSVILSSSVSNWIYWQLYKVLKKILPIYYSKLSTNKLSVNSKSEIIVSLTTFPARIKTVHLTIKSILFQTYKPKRVVLWLSNEQFPNGEKELPNELLTLKKSGLTIEFCDDLKSHKKYYYTFQNYPEYLIATIDDDVYYPKNILKILKDYSTIYPQAIIANRVREISFQDSKIIPYRKWKINNAKSSLPSKKYMPTGVGGVLYKTSFFSERLYSKENIKKLCLNADDVWLKANSLINEKEVVFTCKYYNEFIEVKGSQVESLYSQNVFNATNDIQIQEVFDFFSIDESNIVN